MRPDYISITVAQAIGNRLLRRLPFEAGYEKRRSDRCVLPHREMQAVPMTVAIARGVPVSTHHRIFIVLLSLVVDISIKGIGVLLVSAFVVIPACAAQQLSRAFTHYVLLSVGLGVLSAVFGMVLSTWFNLPSGPSIVATQLVIFLTAMVLPRLRSFAHSPKSKSNSL